MSDEDSYEFQKLWENWLQPQFGLADHLVLIVCLEILVEVDWSEEVTIQRDIHTFQEIEGGSAYQRAESTEGPHRSYLVPDLIGNNLMLWIDTKPSRPVHYDQTTMDLHEFRAT